MDRYGTSDYANSQSRGSIRYLNSGPHFIGQRPLYKRLRAPERGSLQQFYHDITTRILITFGNLRLPITGWSTQKTDVVDSDHNIAFAIIAVHSIAFAEEDPNRLSSIELDSVHSR